MKKITGKTLSILKRLPHFFHPEEVGDLMLQVFETYGKNLEKTESDLYQVLRSHHVQTADNEGSQGLTSPEEFRGDLDKLFALYLEALGGTSQVVKMNPYFTGGSIRPKKLFSALFEEASNPLYELIRSVFEEKNRSIFSRYQIEYTYFQTHEITVVFVLDLLLKRSPLFHYLYGLLGEEELEWLKKYDGAEQIKPALKECLSQFMNLKILRDPSLFQKNFEYCKRVPLSKQTQSLQNRLFQDFLKEKIPNIDQVRKALIQEFNKLIQPNKKHESPIFTKELFSPFTEDFGEIVEKYHNQPVWFHRILLEAAFPFEIEKSYHSYQSRLRALIQVLRNGASTKQGILDIVAANLGIVGGDPEAKAAKAQIQIEEYNPVGTPFADQEIDFYQNFSARNINLDPEAPKIRITMLKSSIQQIKNIKIVDDTQSKQLSIPVAMKQGDSLFLDFEQGSILLNGVEIGDTSNYIPLSIPGETKLDWHFEAEVLTNDQQDFKPFGRFGQHSFDETAWVIQQPIIRIEVLSYEKTPGVFTVKIPWHIPGFTDNFAETKDHPRHQILSLVNRVKGAGIKAYVAYLQEFREDHVLEDQLHFQLEGSGLSDQQEMQDQFTMDSRSEKTENHEQKDKLRLTGVFDYTGFDSLNRFG